MRRSWLIWSELSRMPGGRADGHGLDQPGGGAAGPGRGRGPAAGGPGRARPPGVVAGRFHAGPAGGPGERPPLVRLPRLPAGRPRLRQHVQPTAPAASGCCPRPCWPATLPHVLVHFQFEPDGRITSPQVPGRENFDMAVPLGVSRESVGKFQAQLGEVLALVDRKRLLEMLPESTPVAMPVVVSGPAPAYASSGLLPLAPPPAEPLPVAPSVARAGAHCDTSRGRASGGPCRPTPTIARRPCPVGARRPPLRACRASTCNRSGPSGAPPAGGATPAATGPATPAATGAANRPAGNSHSAVPAAGLAVAQLTFGPARNSGGPSRTAVPTFCRTPARVPSSTMSAKACWVATATSSPKITGSGSPTRPTPRPLA